MSSLQNHYKVLLEEVLERDFVPHLPPLLDQTKPLEQQQRKNLSRAFSAFALHKICTISPHDAAQSVIDDFEDDGIDAIYFHASTETLYLLQSKFKAAEQFRQEEALAYCQGLRKLIRQDLSGFNKNVQDRQLEIEDAIDRCNQYS